MHCSVLFCSALLCSHNTHVSLAYMREHDIEHTIHHRSSSDGTFDKDILNITHSRNYICTGVQLVFRTLLPFYKISLFHFASTMNKTNKNTDTFYSKIYSCCHVYYMDRANRKKLTVHKKIVCIKRNFTAELLATLCLRQENLILSK